MLQEGVSSTVSGVNASSITASFTIGGSSFTVTAGSATVAYQLTSNSLSAVAETVTGSAFSVGGSSFTVSGGSATISYRLATSGLTVSGSANGLGTPFAILGSTFTVNAAGQIGVGTTAPAAGVQFDMEGTIPGDNKFRIKCPNSGNGIDCIEQIINSASRGFFAEVTDISFPATFGDVSNATDTTDLSANGRGGFILTETVSSITFQSGNITRMQIAAQGPVTFNATAPVTISSAVFVGTYVSTQAAGAAGAAVTALCQTSTVAPGVTFASSGGCVCTGGVSVTGTTSETNCQTTGCIPSGWTCQEPGGTGGACSAYANCTRLQ